jgi:hypothetical protein
MPNSVTTIGSAICDYCPLAKITINCQANFANNILTIFGKIVSGHISPAHPNTLKITLSQSLVDTKTYEQMKAYVTEILAIATSGTIMNNIKAKQGLKLDLSNTGLIQSDIEGLPNTLGWSVNFN